MTLDQKIAVLELQVKALIGIVSAVEGGNHRGSIRALDAEVAALTAPKAVTLDEKKRAELDWAAIRE